MHLNIPKFLKILCSSIPDHESPVNDTWRTDGLACRCPLHPGGEPTMHAFLDQCGDARFACSDPKCRFGGDAVSLVSMATGASPSAAVAMFMRGGRFEPALESPLGGAEAAAYADGASSQAAVKAYLSRCQAEMLRHPEKSGIRPGLSTSSSRCLPNGVGLLVRDGVPGCLSEYTRPKYAGRNLVLFPRTFNGDVLSIDVVDATAGHMAPPVSAAVVSPDSGVFNEQASAAVLSGGQAVLVAPDPVSAARACCALSTMWGRDLPCVVYASSMPLPASFSGASRVLLLSFTDSKARLATALSALSPSGVFSGRPDASPSVRVAQTGYASDCIPAEKLGALCNSTSAGRPVSDWIVAEMAELVRKGRVSEVVQAVSSSRLPSVVVAGLARFARRGEGEWAAALADVLDKSGAPETSDMVLANGRSVRRCQSSVNAVTRSGACETLCNVGLSVESKTVSASGEETLHMTAAHQDPDMPTVRFSLPEAAWGSSSRIRKAVSAAFTALGANPYVMFYDVKGYSWRDILCRMAERCPVGREVGSLGADEFGDLNLPLVSVSRDGTVSRQSRIMSVQDCAMSMYSGISDDESGSVEPWARLLGMCGNLYAAGLAMGAMHVLHQMTAPMAAGRAARSGARRHLMYVETEPGIWSAVFQALSSIFSGSFATPILEYADPLSTLSAHSQLGDLPMIASVPTMGAKFTAALDRSRVGLVGLVDTSTAVMSNGRCFATYLTPSRDAPDDRSFLSDRFVAELRAGFPRLLSAYVPRADMGPAYRSARIPCLAAYGECRKVLGADWEPLPEEISGTWFAGTGMSGVNLFFDMVHRGLAETGRKRICVVDGAPQPGRSFTARGQHVFLLGDRVLIGHIVVDVVNKSGDGFREFSVPQLTSELADRGMLRPMPAGMESEADSSRCWCIRRDVWENSVVRPPIRLEPVSSGEAALPGAVRGAQPT